MALLFKPCLLTTAHLQGADLAVVKVDLALASGVVQAQPLPANHKAHKRCVVQHVYTNRYLLCSCYCPPAPSVSLAALLHLRGAHVHAGACRAAAVDCIYRRLVCEQLLRQLQSILVHVAVCMFVHSKQDAQLHWCCCGNMLRWQRHAACMGSCADRPLLT